MARIIKYPAICFYCKKVKQKGEAYLQRTNGAWYCHCFDCCKAKREAEERKESDNVK